MAIKNIEIICMPCKKCEELEDRVRKMIKSIEMTNRTKIVFDFKHTTNLKDISQYSLNPTQTPVIIINGKVEFAGKVDVILLRRRLDAIHRVA